MRESVRTFQEAETAIVQAYEIRDPMDMYLKLFYAGELFALACGDGTKSDEFEERMFGTIMTFSRLLADRHAVLRILNGYQSIMLMTGMEDAIDTQYTLKKNKTREIHLNNRQKFAKEQYKNFVSFAGLKEIDDEFFP